MKTDYHEKELVVLTASKKHERKRLHAFLKKRGYKSEDDFYELFRKGRCAPWQSSAIVGLAVVLSGNAVYETEEDIEEGRDTGWDELRCDYPLATLPRECIAELIREVDALCVEFGLRITWHGEVLDSVLLAKQLNAVADKLSNDWDAPGSETLRILIEQQYGNG